MTAASALTAMPGPVVLLVDDLPDNLKMLSEALDSAGYVVLVATDGASALQRLDYITPDIVLLDAVMPGLDGFETCRRIKQHPRAGHVPVIFMTGLTESQDVLRGFEAGGIDYVTKPLDTAVVLARVEAHRRSHRMMAAAVDAIEAVDTAVVVLDAAGQALWQTAKARQWLQAYCAASAEAVALPESLQAWVNEALPTVDATGVEQVISGATHQLVLRLARREPLRPEPGGPNGELVLLLEERPLPVDPQVKLAADYQLTARELEVLVWVARGKTNRDISEILEISPRTANKHLEHIFVKLGVETRAAAAALATRYLVEG